MRNVICILILILTLLLTLLSVLYNKPITHSHYGLRICTWNIEWFGLLHDKEHLDSLNIPMYSKMITNMHQIRYHMNIIRPDIICFQEIASTETLTVLVKYLSEYTLYSDRSIITPGSQYNVFLVKHNIPVSSFEVIDIKHKMIRIDFKYNGDIVSLYNVHLKAGRSGTFYKTRIKQLDVLQHYIKKSGNTNIIICGDLNSSPGSIELTMLEENYINILFSRKCHLKLEDKTSIWFDVNKNESIESFEQGLVDYMFTSRSMFNLVNDIYIYNIMYQKIFATDSSNKISDHYPVILELN